MTVELPSYNDISTKAQAGLTLSELEMFIHEYDPAEPDDSAQFFAYIGRVLQEQARGFVDALVSDKVVFAVAQAICDREFGCVESDWVRLLETIADEAVVGLKRAALEKRMMRILDTARGVMAAALRGAMAASLGYVSGE